MKTWILLQIAAMAALSGAQQDCSRGACYPPMGDLLLGREQRLQASSTCGLTGAEIFCTPVGQRKMKCCPCDSRNPLGRNAHTIQNVVSSAGPNTWWQSRKDASPVTLQLDLQRMFQLDTLQLSFKGPRPSALVIERTTDFGRTWQPALYMASDCRSTFPHVATSMPRDLQETYCHTLPPAPTSPYSGQTIYFHPLRQFSGIRTPNGQKIEEVSGFTGLRVKLTQLGHVPRVPGRHPSLFYALREMKVLGTCFCHGHASHCLPDTASNQIPNTQVNAVCECQHNTAGVNCERCDDLYNDLPWRPAEEGQTHTCKRCECNNHARRCQFDPALFEASGRRSGGVCEGCMHHTAGPRCDRCAPNYYPNPRSSMEHPDACLQCQCNVAGAESGGQCDQNTGTCRCKANVEGPRCDRCKSGYYGLSTANPLGCSRCSCRSQDSLHSSCDPFTGQCPCKVNVEGLACDRCATGYWNLSSPYGCEPCNCDPTNAHSNTCDQLTGQCQCRSGLGGRTCGGCPDNTYGDPRTGCQLCQCESGGTVTGGCDKRTGACQCRLGVTGARCNTCSRGHCASFPDCQVCPSCFFTLNAQLRNLTLGLTHLSSTLPSLPGGGTGPGDLGPRIRALEATLTQIRDSLPLPPSSANKLTDALAELRRLRNRTDQLDGELFPPGRGADLEPQLEELLALLAGLGIDYNTKKGALRNAVSSNNAGALSAIVNAYKESTDAVKSAEATGKTLEKSAGIREDALDMQNRVQPANTRDLEKLDRELESKPNLTPTALQVCGSTRVAPCTPQQCDGELCPPGGAPPCGRGKHCVGALPQGARALEDTEVVKAKLQDLNDKITQAAAQIQETQDSANRVRLSAVELANQIKQARDDLEEDLRDTKDFVKQMKDFLSDPSSDPTHLQEVCEGILNAKLPLSLAALKRKLKEIRDLASGLPNSTRVLDDTAPQLDKARQLLEEAQSARDAALGVKGDVDGLLTAMNNNENTLTDMDAKVQESLDIVDDVKKNMKKTKDQLDPAQKALGEVSGLVDGMRPQLDRLKDLVQSGGKLAEKAQEDASNAQAEANAAAMDLEALEKQLEQLKQAAQANGQAGAAGERLQKLQDEAGALLQDTVGMMRALADKEDSLRQATVELHQKSQKLIGLDVTLQELVTDINGEVQRLSICQG